MLPALLARHSVDLGISGPALQLPVPHRVRTLSGPDRPQAGTAAVHDDAAAGRAAQAVSLRSLSTYALGAGDVLRTNFVEDLCIRAARDTIRHQRIGLQRPLR